MSRLGDQVNFGDLERLRDIGIVGECDRFMTAPARCQILRTVPEINVPSSSRPRSLPVKSPASWVPGLRECAR